MTNKIKLCFSTLGCYDLKLDDILDLAREYHVSAIEVRGIDSEMSNDKISCFYSENQIETRKKFEISKVNPLILGTSCKFHDPLTCNKMIEKAINEMKIAYQNGFKAIRVFGNLLVEPKEQCIAQVAHALDQVCCAADEMGIQVYLEVHGDFNTVEVLQSVIEQMKNTEHFALIWDIYHTHAVYGTSWKTFYDALKPWIVHVHIKDCIGKDLVLPSKGELEIVPIIQYLMSQGYDGYFSLEWERKWVPELPELKVALDELNTLLEQHHILIED